MELSPGSATAPRGPPVRPALSRKAAQRFRLECLEHPRFDGLSRPAHQAAVETQVVNAEQPMREDLASHVQMAQVGATVATCARDAVAGLVEWSRVVLVARVLDHDLARLGEDLTVSRVARRHHAVEQIDADTHRPQEVGGRAHAHQVTNALGVEPGRDFGQRAMHRVVRLTDTEAAEGQSLEREFAELAQMTQPKLHVGATLHDAEHRLAWATRDQAALRPARRALERGQDDLPW